MVTEVKPEASRVKKTVSMYAVLKFYECGMLIERPVEVPLAVAMNEEARKQFAERLRHVVIKTWTAMHDVECMRRHSLAEGDIVGGASFFFLTPAWAQV